MAGIRLPDEVKEARGTLQPCRTNPNMPKPAHIEAGHAPSELKKDEAVVWDRLATSVNKLRVLTEGDMEAFTLMVLAVASAIRASRNPKATINQRIRATQAAFASLREFGLTPASRARVNAAPIEDADEISEFIN